MNPYQETELDEARMSAAQRLSNAWDKQRAKSDASLRRTPSSIPKKEEPKKEVAEGSEYKSRHAHKQEQDKAYADYRTKHNTSSMALMTRAEFAKDQRERAAKKKQGVAEGVSLKQKHEDKKRADQNQVRYGKMTQAEFDKKWTRTERPKPTDKEQGVAEENLSELNKDTLHSYAKKAEKDIETQHKEIGKQLWAGKPVEANKASARMINRFKGVDRAETRLNKESAICPSCQVDPCICEDSHGFVGEGKKPGYLAPGWMLKKYPELGDKVKAKIKIGKARAKSHGDINAGKEVKEEKDYSKPINSLKDKLMAMKKELSIVQKSHAKMEKEEAKEKEKANEAPTPEDHASALNHFKDQYLNAKRNKDDKGANDAARVYHDYSTKLSDLYQRKLKGLAMGEETNPYLQETLSPNDSAGEYVSDFEKSGAPQFKGKTKEKRVQMAVAAYMSAKKGRGSELPAGNLGNGGSVG